VYGRGLFASAPLLDPRHHYHGPGGIPSTERALGDAHTPPSASSPSPIARSAVLRAMPQLAAEDNKMKAVLLAVLSPPSWTILGLALTMVGLLLLLLFGMPYSLRPDEGDFRFSDGSD